MSWDFYSGDVCTVARALIGCVVRHGETAGVIVETEAYHESEPACHAYVWRTPRTVTLFGPPGLAYVYRSYGVHWCVNLVCAGPGRAEAALVRALKPERGLELMRARRGVDAERALCSGPGKLCQALAVTRANNGQPLDEPPFMLLAREATLEIAIGRRIGISSGVEREWRYGLAGSPYVSRRF